MLTRTITPHSIHSTSSTLTDSGLELIVNAPPQVIVNPADIPEMPLYRHPDLRQTEKQIEKLFTFATEANRLGNLKANLDLLYQLTQVGNRHSP